MTPQNPIPRDIADWLATASDAEVRWYIGYLLEIVGLDRNELRMWANRIPTEEP